jgi:hypothetical protein
MRKTTVIEFSKEEVEDILIEGLKKLNPHVKIIRVEFLVKNDTYGFGTNERTTAIFSGVRLIEE